MFSRSLTLHTFTLLCWAAAFAVLAATAGPDNPLIKLKLLDECYRIELADTPRRRVVGLMYRTSLEPDSGMLFLYPHSGDRQIWMKNTLIPLTVIWLDDEARIIGLQLLSPCSKEPCPNFGAGDDTRFVLELHADAYPRFNLGDQLPALLDYKASR